MPKNLKLIFIIFRTFRVESNKILKTCTMHIVSALVELNDRSNISGTSDDSDFDETWLPAGHRNMVISDAEETSEEEVGVLLDGSSVPHMLHSLNPQCPTCHIVRLLSAPHAI